MHPEDRPLRARYWRWETVVALISVALATGATVSLLIGLNLGDPTRIEAIAAGSGSIAVAALSLQMAAASRVTAFMSTAQVRVVWASIAPDGEGFATLEVSVINRGGLATEILNIWCEFEDLQGWASQLERVGGDPKDLAIEPGRRASFRATLLRSPKGDDKVSVGPVLGPRSEIRVHEIHPLVPSAWKESHLSSESKGWNDHGPAPP